MWVDFVCFQDWVSLFYKNERTILVIVVIYARVGLVRRERERVVWMVEGNGKEG